jgi:two-component system NarL family sensor kinase
LANVINDRSVDSTDSAEIRSAIKQKDRGRFSVAGRRPTVHRNGRNLIRELDRERSRIARELHAGAGQPLAGITLNLEILNGCSAALPQRGREAIVRLQALAEQALGQIRAISHSLHPPDWQCLKIGDALRALLGSSGLSDHIDAEFDISDLALEPSHTAKIALYRCAQESIANIVRHSGATRFRLTLVGDGAMAELRVEDNGRGFTLESPGRIGIGLLSMRETAGVLGGDCHIRSGAGGTSVVVRIPLSED